MKDFFFKVKLSLEKNMRTCQSLSTLMSQGNRTVSSNYLF